MKNSANPLRRFEPNSALASHCHSRRRTKRTQMYGDVLKTARKSSAIGQIQPKLRITAVMQAQILRLYMQGCSLCEISRRTHRARQTVTKVVRAPDVQAKMKALREQLIGESDDWAESLNYRVRTEPDGEMAYRLLKDFGVIPSTEKREQSELLNNWSKNIDLETMARAKELAIDALRRGSVVGTESSELEELAPGEPATSF